MLLDTYLLSYIHRGITVEMGRIIAPIVRNFATDPRKQSLGLGPFITRIVHYLEIDIVGIDLTMVALSTIPTNLVVLRNMGMVERDEEGPYTLRAEPSQQEIADKLVDPPAGTPPLPVAPSFVPRIAFEHFVAQQMG